MNQIEKEKLQIEKDKLALEKTFAKKWGTAVLGFSGVLIGAIFSAVVGLTTVRIQELENNAKDITAASEIVLGSAAT